jgi:hypothetical protein
MFKNIFIQWAWPMIQKMLIEYIKSDEYQKRFVELINTKLDIPNLSEASEFKLLNEVYDVAQEVALETIQNFKVVA